MYPLKMIAPCKDYIWGGTKLKTEWGKVSDLAKVAESWELSSYPGSESVVKNGSLSGKTLTEAIDALGGKAALGTDCEAFDRFPVLIKLIDAKNDLSIQVHPDDEYALKNENEFGKTEMWYIVDADEGASLVYGFNRDVTKEEYRAAIESNTLMELLNKVPVHKGDVFFIPAGMVHAIGSGILIAEIQQNSNITYRVYDYGRLGADGKPRALHVDKAVEVSNLKKPTAVSEKGETKRYDGYDETPLASCKYFTTSRVEVKSEAKLCACEKSFVNLLFLSGEGTIRYAGGTVDFKKGEDVFVPAGMGEFTVCGASTFVLTRV